MGKSKKLLRRILLAAIAVLIVMAIAIQVAYHQKLNDDFYSSAIPNDLIPLGMRSYDVKSVLGMPEQETIMKDYYQVGFSGNKFAWRETGEVMLTYNMQIFDESAAIEYAYYKPGHVIDHVLVHVGSYKTIDEAYVMAEKLLNYAKQNFDLKGEYQHKPIDSVVAHSTYRLIAKNNTDTIMYEISIMDASTLGLTREAPYSINIHQTLLSK